MHRTIIPLCMTVLSLAAPIAQAEVVYRLNSTDDLNLASGWENESMANVVPGSSDIATFYEASVSGATSPPSVVLGADLSWDGLAINTSAFNGGSIIDQDAHTLTLGSSGLVYSGSRNSQLGVNLKLGVAQIWSYGSNSKMFTINGDVATQGFDLTLGGNAEKNFFGTITGGGNFMINAGDSTLTLGNTSSFEFTIGSNGINTSISGNTGSALAAEGSFNLDLGGADTIVGSTWELVETADLGVSYGASFNLDGFSETAVDSGIWQAAANGVTYQFTESNSMLSVIPEPQSYGYLAVVSLLALIGRRRLSSRRGRHS